MNDPANQEQAACHNVYDDHFFGDASQQQRMAREYCVGCRVVTECLREAIEEKIEHGVRGGMTEHERRIFIKTRRVPSNVNRRFNLSA